MDASSEIKFLKAKVALLETEKKHLIQKVADLEKRKFQAPHNILSPICKKPAIKCSACPNRELSPLTDDVIKKHLEGMCSVGIYPMLPDETCCFLAVDFDGEGWIDNISAFKETCSQKNIPVSIERSKSVPLDKVSL